MLKLLLLSNSTNYGEGYLEYPKASIRSFLGDEVKNVLFIPYAGIRLSYDQYTSKVAVPFEKMGYQVRGIHSFEDPRKALMNAEAIAVGGGNTFALLDQLYKLDLIGAIKLRVSEGLPYIGWSAGSNIAAPTICTTNDMPIIKPPSFDALNLVPFQINPHYTEATLPRHGGESRIDRLMEYITLNSGVNVVCIPEGNLLKVNGKNMKMIGNGEIKVFRQGTEPRIYTSEDDLSFLANSY